MEKYTKVPEVNGLFWYYEQGKEIPRPVLIDLEKYGTKIKSFNGAEQSWLRAGEYLIGPQPAPASTEQGS